MIILVKPQKPESDMERVLKPTEPQRGMFSDGDAYLSAMWDYQFAQAEYEEWLASPTCKAEMALYRFPLVEQVIEDKRAVTGGRLTTDEAINQIWREYTLYGPYTIARDTGILVNDSGEEFAIQWMSFYNILHPGTY